MNQRKLIFYCISGAIVIFIIISVFVSCSMQDMQPAFREDNTQPLDTLNPVSVNSKQNIACGWDAEEITAQQLDRIISFQQKINLGQEIRNLEANMQFNRNKAAVMFYLAYAYEQSGDNAKAIQTYDQLRNNYNNRQINLYIFNAPRVAANMRTYSVSTYEESLLRQFALSSDTKLIQPLLTSNATYGIEGKEGFQYTDLAGKNLKNYKLQQPLSMSYDQFARLAEAKKTINNFISACLKEPTSNINTESPLRALITEQLYDNISALASIFQNLTNVDKIELEYTGLRKSGILYYYSFKVVASNTFIEVVDNGNEQLISRVK